MSAHTPSKLLAEFPVIAVPVHRAVVYLAWCRAAVWTLCVGGLAMGYLVSRADTLRSARFTALGGLPGWPEVWGLTLMALGALSLIARFIGARGLRARRLDGNLLAALSMIGMALWYTIFASSLILGTGQYGYAPYLTLAGLHFIFAVLVRQTNGLRIGSGGSGRD